MNANVIPSLQHGSRRHSYTPATLFPALLLLLGILLCALPALAAAAPAAAAAAAPSAELIKRGEYVARLGDCVACHTSPNGAAMAGGLELKTPFGTIYSTNITPDAKTGLGRYLQFCATCHRRDGRGVENIFPTLAQNYSVQSKDPTTVIHIALTGWQTAVTQHSPRSFGMPAYDQLSNTELAEILSFVRSKWGNQGAPVTPAQVAKVRKELQLKGAPATDFETPRYAALKADPNAKQLIHGMQLMTETRARLPKNVGNDLNCSSCHLNGGTVASGSPFLGIAAFFPAEAPRAGKVINLGERINGCFKRSMNGKPLPADGPDLQAMVAYIEWMKGATRAYDKVPGRGVAKIDRNLLPDAVNGKKVYAQQCSVCHGVNGEGIKGADGVLAFPPLWGERSFNIGAGMARTYTAAGFVKANMVMGHGQKFPLGQGNLSDQDAVDVAEYFSHMPRPDFPDKVKDWPHGGKPADARY